MVYLRFHALGLMSLSFSADSPSFCCDDKLSGESAGVS